MTSRQIVGKLALGAIFFGVVGWWVAPYFAGTKSLQPIAVQLGSLTVYWYGLLLAVAVAASYWWVARPLARTRGITEEAMLTVSIWTIIGGLIGARMLFVLLKWSDYAGNWSEIWFINAGGLSIHGALLGGVVAVWLTVRSLKISLWPMLDIMAPAVVLGQAIGRWGNFVNQEAFGGPTNLPWKMFVAPQFRPPQWLEAEFFHPTFLYESLGCLAIFGWLYRQSPNLFRQPGAGLAWYLLLYSSLRFLLEFFRVDSDFWGGLTIAQWGSLAIVGLAVYLLNRRHHA